MMKFIETLDGSYLNVDDISCITHEEYKCGPRFGYSSCIYLKNGQKKDFLEVVSHFNDEKLIEHKFDATHLISLHKYALEYIIDISSTISKLDDIEDYAWRCFMIEFTTFQEKENAQN